MDQINSNDKDTISLIGKNVLCNLNLFMKDHKYDLNYLFQYLQKNKDIQFISNDVIVTISKYEETGLIFRIIVVEHDNEKENIIYKFSMTNINMESLIQVLSKINILF